MPSACGGKGACGVCEVIVREGGGDLLPTETGYISRGEAKRGHRLACQVKVKRDMKIEIAPEVFDVRKWRCKVVSNRNVATFIKELKLALPEGEEVPFRAGGYVQIECPPHAAATSGASTSSRSSATTGTVRPVALQVGRRPNRSSAPTRWRTIRTRRASCCSRSASPSRPTTATTIPPGIMSSWVFNLKPGDEVTVSGPVRRILRARHRQGDVLHRRRRRHGADALAHLRPVQAPAHHAQDEFWYGARSLREAFYVDEFERCSATTRTSSGTWRCPSRCPRTTGPGPTGFIHNVLHDQYLKNHPAPEDIEYYMCGPGPDEQGRDRDAALARRRPREHPARRLRLTHANTASAIQACATRCDRSGGAQQGGDELFIGAGVGDGRRGGGSDGGARDRRRAGHERGRPRRRHLHRARPAGARRARRAAIPRTTPISLVMTRDVRFVSPGHHDRGGAGADARQPPPPPARDRRAHGRRPGVDARLVPDHRARRRALRSGCARRRCRPR